MSSIPRIDWEQLGGGLRWQALVWHAILGSPGDGLVGHQAGQPSAFAHTALLLLVLLRPGADDHTCSYLDELDSVREAQEQGGRSLLDIDLRCARWRISGLDSVRTQEQEGERAFQELCKGQFYSSALRAPAPAGLHTKPSSGSTIAWLPNAGRVGGL
jgi:hypothetical protein